MNRIQCTIDNAQLTITAAIIILLLTACTGHEEATLIPATPITIGKLQVAGGSNGADTRAVGPWTPQYEAFNDGDQLRVTINPSNPIVTIYQYQAPGNWALASGATQLYKEELPANIESIHTYKGNFDLQTNQSTFANYCAADYIGGTLALSGHELVTNTTTGPLRHQYVDVVINITPVSTGGHWDGVDFAAYMRDEATVRFLDNSATPVEITPFLATLTPQMATYRAVIPFDRLPKATTTEAKNIITITSKNAAPITGKYTLDAAGTIAKGNRLTIDIEYDNKRSLAGVATVSTWTTGPEYEVDYYGYMVINSAQSLKTFRDLVNAGNYTLKAVQTADIDLKGEKWGPIGYCDAIRVRYPFKGVYNGGGHTISGLNVENSFGQGLFAHTNGAILTGINLIEPSVTGRGGFYAGALVGLAFDTHISNCSVQGGTISGDIEIGGLIGESSGTIVACSATDVTVTAPASSAGGLVGVNTGTIAFCHAAGVVKGGNRGALVGLNYSNIYSCYATIPTGSDATALVGEEQNPAGIKNSIAIATNNPDTDNPGDIVRAYAGTVSVNTDKYSIRKVDAGIWGAGNKPELVW